MDEYTGLGGKHCPILIENVFRGIGRLFSGNKVLRTTKGIGAEDAFEDGARIGGGGIKHFIPAAVPNWSFTKAIELDASAEQMLEPYRRRIAASITAVLGFNGDEPASEVILWLDPSRSGAQYWAILAAKSAGIPVHNLADSKTFDIWSDWLEQVALKR